MVCICYTYSRKERQSRHSYVLSPRKGKEKKCFEPFLLPSPSPSYSAPLPGLKTRRELIRIFLSLRRAPGLLRKTSMRSLIFPMSLYTSRSSTASDDIRFCGSLMEQIRKMTNAGGSTGGGLKHHTKLPFKGDTTTTGHRPPHASACGG